MTISLSTRFFSRNYLFTFSLGKRKTKIHAFVSRISYYFLFLVRLPPCFAPPSPLWTRDLPVRRCSIWVGSNSHGAPVIDFMVFWEIYVIDSFFFLLFRFASLSPPSPLSPPSLSLSLPFRCLWHLWFWDELFRGDISNGSSSTDLFDSFDRFCIGLRQSFQVFLFQFFFFFVM